MIYRDKNRRDIGIHVIFGMTETSSPEYNLDFFRRLIHVLCFLESIVLMRTSTRDTCVSVRLLKHYGCLPFAPDAQWRRLVLLSCELFRKAFLHYMCDYPASKIYGTHKVPMWVFIWALYGKTNVGPTWDLQPGSRWGPHGQAHMGYMWERYGPKTHLLLLLLFF